MGRSVFRCQLCKITFIVFILVVGGCSNQGFKVSNLAKGDIDFVADASYQQINDYLHTLTVKLYKRNPRELRKSGVASADVQIKRLFETEGPLVFAELNGAKGIDAMQLALDQAYSGDRVFALMAGLIDMVKESYGYKTDFYMFDQLDEDKLYKSARNVEILAWRLANNRDDSGDLLLLTNSRQGEMRNLSYARLFGSMIAVQDLMAQVIAKKYQRLINKITVNTASLIFIPL
jgi:hypothetical protein